MALDPVVKVEITAHNSVMDDVIQKLQEQALVQIDPHSISGWESEKEVMQNTEQRCIELRKEVMEIERALSFLEKHGPKVPFFQKLSAKPEELSKNSLKKLAQENNADSIVLQALELESRINDKDNEIKESVQKIDELIPLAEFQSSLARLSEEGDIAVLISKMSAELYEEFIKKEVSELIHIEKISGDETVYFLIGIKSSTMPITDSSNLKIDKKFIAQRLTCFLPAGSAGKKVCVCQRKSAVN